MKILINCLGIQDSGGITVLEKLFKELKVSEEYKYLIICNENININKLVSIYNKIKNFNFILFENRGFLHRLYYENFCIRKIVKAEDIKLVYNFSGSSQFFLNTKQLTKVQNLLFYSKELDFEYFKKNEYIKWFKQVFFKRFVFKLMLNQCNYIDIQSEHVKSNLANFINIKNKKFFIKSDIDISNDKFLIPKKYDFTLKVTFIYIVGPHFEFTHKNFIDFVEMMLILDDLDMDFEIKITLSNEQLNSSTIWNKKLNSKTKFLGYLNKSAINDLFQNNTILVSTSIVETLGLHVIEATQNGVFTIVPEQNYALSVYGRKMVKYKLFSVPSIKETVEKVFLLNNNETKDIILTNQRYLLDNENEKFKTIVSIFDEILKGDNV